MALITDIGKLPFSSLFQCECDFEIPGLPSIHIPRANQEDKFLLLAMITMILQCSSWRGGYMFLFWQFLASMFVIKRGENTVAKF